MCFKSSQNQLPETFSPSVDGDVDRALGDLIRILSTIEPPPDPLHMIAAADFLAWFHDRFHLPAGACSPKAFGDALAFGIRLGLIPAKKVARTREKITTYIGIDVPTLDAALRCWHIEVLHNHGIRDVDRWLVPTASTANLDAMPGDTPEEPWDAAIERVQAPTTWEEVVEEEETLEWLESSEDFF